MVDEQLKGRDIRDPRKPITIRPADRIRPDRLATLHRRLHDAGAEVQPAHRILEIGTGSGYQAAVLGLLASQVYTREIVAPSQATA